MNKNCINKYTFIGKKEEFLSVNLISHGVSSSDFKKSSFRYTTTIKTTPLTTNPDIDINSLELLAFVIVQVIAAFAAFYLYKNTKYLIVSVIQQNSISIPVIYS